MSTCPTNSTTVTADRPAPTRLTVAGVVLGHPVLIALSLAAALVLAGLASYHDGSILLNVDEPVQRWVQDRRSSGLDTVFRIASRMGSNVVIFSLAAVLAALTWKRCRFLAMAIIAAVALRPGMEYVVKALIARPRPDIDRLVPGNGPSHPSGHVLASVALYGLLPAVVAVFTGSRRAWAWTVGLVLAGVPFIAASRVYLGVHWFFDVVGGFLVGTLYLLVVEYLYHRVHPEGGCAHS